MIRTCLLFFCSLLIGTGSLSAQVKKCFKLLEKGSNEEALSCFRAEAGTQDQSIPAAYGALKAAAGVSASKLKIEVLTAYDQMLSRYNAADAPMLAKWSKEFGITAEGLEQAYVVLFEQMLRQAEEGQHKASLRDSFLNAVTVIPQPYRVRFNKLMINQRVNPSTGRGRMDTSRKSGQTPVYVDRKAPKGSAMEFVPGINTSGSEYIPVVSADGKIMYFVGSDRADNYSREDVYYTERQADGSWSTPQIDTFFSGPGNEAVVSMSADGNNLVLFLDGKPHISTRTTTGWSEPAPILLQKRVFAWIGMASITRNGEALIFEAKESESSDIDIYVALRNKKGWEIPFSLGSPVNSRLNEHTPFLHSDFKTLYFSSKGHDATGGYDVFKSTRLDDTWKKWSTPVNLGPAVNSPNDEYGFCITPAGNVAYLGASTGDFKDMDIFRIPLDAAARPEAQVIITGTLKDSNGKSIGGSIRVEDAQTKNILQTVTTQPNGQYSFSIPKTAKIYYYATGDGLVTTKKTFVDASTYKQDVATESVEIITANQMESEGKALELKDLLFDFGKSELRPEAEAELKRIYAGIQQFHWNIEVGGHTDNVGSESSNRQLSTRRAQVVRDFLLAQGYPEANISFKGYGSSVPIEGNDTENGRARNRRVEIRVKK